MPEVADRRMDFWGTNAWTGLFALVSPAPVCKVKGLPVYRCSSFLGHRKFAIKLAAVTGSFSQHQGSTDELVLDAHDHYLLHIRGFGSVPQPCNEDGLSSDFPAVTDLTLGAKLAAAYRNPLA
jgi:hypothetical protein